MTDTPTPDDHDPWTGDGCAWIIGGMLAVLIVGIFLAEWLTP